MTKPIESLRVWRDSVARNGPECMAVDELLLQSVEEVPVLRFYDWEGAWASVGYFGDLAAAQKHFGPELAVVRRWTGGGVVDHRQDLTYSLIVPRMHDVARMRGAESYAAIHAAVVQALQDSGSRVRLLPDDGGADSTLCFEKPVAWDIVDESGAKVAGAGQRRTRWGLLHQGSVQVPATARACFSGYLEQALSHELVEWTPPSELLEEAKVLASEKYTEKPTG